MAITTARSLPLFEKFVQTCYWRLFLPHSSLNELTMENYSKTTNSVFPDAPVYAKRYRDLLRELPIVIRQEFPELGSIAQSAMSAFYKLITERNVDTPIAPILMLYRGLYKESAPSNPIGSLIYQIFAGYSDIFEGDIRLVVPTSKGQSCSYIPVGVESVRPSDDPDSLGRNIPPFWKWYLRIVRPSVSKIDDVSKQEKALQHFFRHLFFPYIPFKVDEPVIYLPLPNILRMQSLLRMVLPDNNGKVDNAFRLYSSIRFVTFGVTDVRVLGDTGFTPTDVSEFNSYLQTATSREADLVSRYNIIDFNNSQVVGALESLDKKHKAIKPGLLPPDELDPDLDEGSHDPNDDVELDPTIDRTSDYGLEARDFDDDHTDEQAENFGSGDDKSDGNDSSGDGTSNDPSTDDPVDSGDDSDGGNPNAPGSDQPLGSDGSKPDDQDKDKKVSSKNKISRPAYKASIGNQPFKLATDNDPEGHFYRQKVCMLNKQLQEDPGDVVPRSAKSALNEWCKLWINCADIRYTVNLIKELGLTRYMRA